MNAYLAGAYALAGRRPSFAALARERPLSIGLAGNIARACIGALEEKYMDATTDPGQGARIREKLRQLHNMSRTIDRCRVAGVLDFLPDDAADILGEVAAEAADETGQPHATGTPDDDTGTGDDRQPFDGDDQQLVSDFGFELEPETGVLDEDWGDFEFDTDADDSVDDVPGLEDAEWGEVLGAFDLLLEQRKMNELRTVTLTVARSMVKYGLAVINQAISTADHTSTGVFSSGLPGGTTRKNCQAHLQWHDNKLAQLTSAPNSTLYDSADDLKKWVMQAFIEANAVEEGAAAIISMWNDMWEEIAAAIAALPGDIAKKVKDVAWYATTGFWIGVGAVGLLGIAATVFAVRSGAHRYVLPGGRR